MKVLFEYGSRYVVQRLKETGSLEREETLALNTSVAKIPCPYDPARIKEPNGYQIGATINSDDLPKHLGETTMVNVSGGASINSGQDTNVSGDVVGRDKVSTNVTHVYINSTDKADDHPLEKKFLIGEQLRIAREDTGLRPSRFIELIDFHSEKLYQGMEANEIECPESVINRIYEATGILPGWLKDPGQPKYQVEPARDWLMYPRETAHQITQPSTGEIYVTIAVSIPARDRLLWRGKNLWARVTNDYLHVGVCVPIAEYRYRIFDTYFPAEFGNAHERERYARPFYLFLRGLFDRFDVNCHGLILSDYNTDHDLYEGKIYPRQVFSSPKVFWRINWVHRVLEKKHVLDPSYVAKNCGKWVENMQRVFSQLGDDE